MVQSHTKPDRVQGFRGQAWIVRNDLRLLVAGAGPPADFGCGRGIESSPIVAGEMAIATVAVRPVSRRQDRVPRMAGYDASTARTAWARIGLVMAPSLAISFEGGPALVRTVVACRVIADANSR